MQMVGAFKKVKCALFELCDVTLSDVIWQVGLRGLGEDHLCRTGDVREHVFDLCIDRSKPRRDGEPLVGAPLKSTGHLF